MVYKVEQALYTDASEPIKAANNPPANTPRKPTGIIAFTITGNAALLSSNCIFPCTLKVYAIKPGIKKMKKNYGANIFFVVSPRTSNTAFI